MSTPHGNLIDYINSPAQLKNQYRDPKNLNARVAIYRFAKPDVKPWPTWIFDQIEFPSGAHILEIGCGAAGLWKANMDRIGKDWRLTLTDLMPGMLAASRQTIGNDPRFDFALADAMDLPFDAARFDIVIANHMLYHVPLRGAALRQIARVLKPAGRFYATTNSRRHLLPIKQLIGQFLTDGENPRPDRIYFVMETGEFELRPYFQSIEKRVLPGELAITQSQAVLDYVLSIESAPQRLSSQRLTELQQIVEDQIVRHGAFLVPTESGMFIASSPSIVHS